MPSRLALLIAAAFVSLLAMTADAAERAPASRASTAAAENDANARVIVKYRTDGSLMRESAAAVNTAAREPRFAAAMSQRLGLTLSDGRVLGQRTQVLRGQGLTSTALAARLAADSDVEYAVPDERRHAFSTPTDPLFPDGLTSTTPAVGQWYLRAPAAPALAAINAVGAWDTTAGSSSITVAVVDTGVRFDHPDLAGKLYAGYDFVSDADIANDGGARDSDASDPGDWVTQGDIDGNAKDFSACKVESSSWHGTQTAGLIGASTNNGIGMASVGNQVMVLPLRALGKCGGFDSDIIAAMQWAAGLSADSSLPANTHPARLINLSLGSQGSCSQVYVDVMAQLTAARVIVVAAAGNDVGLAVSTPANCPNVIAVGGVRHTGTKVGYSDLGPQVAISAPAGNCLNLTGTCLYPMITTTNTGTTSPGTNTYSNGDSDPSLGTSFSAPLVTGTAALMLSLNPTLTPATIKSLLQSTARAFPTSGAENTNVAACRAPNGVSQDECYCTTATCGAGLLDASAAVKAVVSAALPVASIASAGSSVTIGSSLTLDGSGSTAGNGKTIAAYAWSLANSSVASISSASNGASVTLLAKAAGSDVATLTVTDNAGATSTTSFGVTVVAAAGTTPVTTPATTGSSGGGGGGALGWSGLLALLAAVVVVGWQKGRR